MLGFCVFLATGHYLVFLISYSDAHGDYACCQGEIYNCQSCNRPRPANTLNCRDSLSWHAVCSTFLLVYLIIAGESEMHTAYRRTALIASTALSLSFVAHSAEAFPTLPGLPNLNFTQFTGSAPKNLFSVVKPVGWTGGGDLVSTRCSCAAMPVSARSSTKDRSRPQQWQLRAGGRQPQL